MYTDLSYNDIYIYNDICIYNDIYIYIYTYTLYVYCIYMCIQCVYMFAWVCLRTGYPNSNGSWIIYDYLSCSR